MLAGPHAGNGYTGKTPFKLEIFVITQNIAVAVFGTGVALMALFAFGNFVALKQTERRDFKYVPLIRFLLRVDAAAIGVMFAALFALDRHVGVLCALLGSLVCVLLGHLLNRTMASTQLIARETLALTGLLYALYETVLAKNGAWALLMAFALVALVLSAAATTWRDRREIEMLAD